MYENNDYVDLGLFMEMTQEKEKHNSNKELKDQSVTNIDVFLFVCR